MLSVNQNMRFDQSMRVLKQLLDRGDLGEPVIATIEMRAIPHWQDFLRDYDRLTLLNMSIHHLDVLRFLFGDPTEIFTAARPDPRTAFAHTDGITASTLQFPSGLLAVSLEDVWSRPARRGLRQSDIYIKWRVEGTEGVAQGTIGWPDYPDGSPSTLRYCSLRATGGDWVEPTLGHDVVPARLQGRDGPAAGRAARRRASRCSAARDNVKTMALVEAGYRSMEEGRSVKLAEIGY